MTLLFGLLGCAFLIIWWVITSDILTKSQSRVNEEGASPNQWLIFLMSLCFTPLIAIMYLQAFYPNREQ